MAPRKKRVPRELTVERKPDGLYFYTVNPHGKNGWTIVINREEEQKLLAELQP